MRAHNNNDPRNLAGRKKVVRAFEVLEAMYGTRGQPDFEITRGMGYDATRNAKVIAAFKRLHSEEFGR